MDTLEKCLHPSNQDAAIIISGSPARMISHASLAENVKTLQQRFESTGLQHGTKVSMVLTNSHVFTVAFLALTLGASTVAPLNHGLKKPEFEVYYKDFGAEVVVLSPEEVEKQGAAYAAAKDAGLRIVTCSTTNDGDVGAKYPDETDTETTNGNRESEPGPDDVALVLHTSGTTGKPKAVPLTHGNIAYSISNIVRHYELTSSDRSPVIMPLFHIHGLVAGLFAPLASGAAIIFTAATSGITPTFFREAVTHKATWYTGTPTLHKLVAQIPMKVKPNFRFVRSCSSRLEGALLKKLEERYGCPIVEAYAMTEAAHQVCSNPVDSTKTRQGSVGMPTGVDVKILDDQGNEVERGEIGEVCISGTNVMSGYMGNAEANSKCFTSSGHFRTGDQGKMSDDGYVMLTGRIKELVNKGGEKISPVEIDDVVNQHGDVDEAVAFAMPDDMYGEDIGLAVVLKSGAQVKEADLKTWVGGRLLQIKVPKKVFFVETIPKTPVGKMQRGLVAKSMLGENE